MPSLNSILETALYVADRAFCSGVLGLPCILGDNRMRAYDVGGNGVLPFFEERGSLTPMETSGGLIPPQDPRPNGAPTLVHRGERVNAKPSTTTPILLTGAAALLMASGAHAQIGPSTLSMTCAQAAALVASRGVIVLSTGATTYDRFVQHSGFCVYGDREDLAWVPTQDLAQCPLKVCRSANRWSTR